MFIAIVSRPFFKAAIWCSEWQVRPWNRPLAYADLPFSFPEVGPSSQQRLQRLSDGCWDRRCSAPLERQAAWRISRHRQLFAWICCIAAAGMKSSSDVAKRRHNGDSVIEAVA